MFVNAYLHVLPYVLLKQIGVGFGIRFMVLDR